MWTNRYRYKGCLEGHTDWVNSLLIYNTKFLVSCSDDKTVKVTMMKTVDVDLGHKYWNLYNNLNWPYRRYTKHVLLTELSCDLWK